MDILEERWVKGVKSALGEACTVRVIDGVTEEKIKLHQLTLGKVEEKCRNWSERVSSGKANTATKTESSSIAEWLKFSKPCKTIE